VVDDNQLTLPGFVEALQGCAEVEVVAGLNHDQALAWEGDWSTVDALVLDAADEGRAGDQFPGVAVVRRVRAATAGPGPLIVVVTGHYLHDGLRHRMAKAGADFYFLRADLRSPEALVDVVLRPDRHRRGVPDVIDGNAPRVLGLGPASDVESFVGLVEAGALGDALTEGHGRREGPRSRRWSRFRREAARSGGITAVNLTTGDTPLGQDTPSIRQLARLWQWAARIRRPE
jgi:CheY-like chemotaxis protein